MQKTPHRLIRLKIHLIAKHSFRSYDQARRRVLILAPVMKGNTLAERVDQATEMILIRIFKQQLVFRNVDFTRLYYDVIPLRKEIQI